MIGPEGEAVFCEVCEDKPGACLREQGKCPGYPEEGPASQEQLAADRLEASSIRYGVWLRLAFLSSGNWAVYHDSEEGGGLETGRIIIMSQLDIEHLKALSINEQARAEERRIANLDRIESGPTAKPLKQVAAVNLEDMGL